MPRGDERVHDGKREGEAVGGGAAGAAASIRRSIARLAALDAERRREAEALAFVLARVADADGVVCAREARTMERVLGAELGLAEDEAALAVEIATHGRRFADAARAYRISRSLRPPAGEDRASATRLLDELREVADADGCRSQCELAEIRQIAAELGIAGAGRSASGSRTGSSRGRGGQPRRDRAQVAACAGLRPGR